MKQKAYIWRIIAIIIVGLAIVYEFIITADEMDLLDIGLYLFFGLIFLIAFLYNLFRDFNDYAEFKKLKYFIPSMTGLLLIVGMIIIKQTQKSRDDSPIVIRATYSGNFNGIELDLREDKTYKITSRNIAQDETFRGKYEIKDTIIILDTLNIADVIISKYLVIRPIKEVDKSMNYYIFQVEPKNHEVLDQEFKFKIEDDKRQ